VLPMIEQAKAGNAHEALGYPSWTAYVKDKFGDALARLRKADRLPLVEMMADQGMSTRAIAVVVGVSKDTVARDLRAGVSHETPDEPVENTSITGLDGKTYTRPERTVHDDNEDADPNRFASPRFASAKVKAAQAYAQELRDRQGTGDDKPRPDTAHAAYDDALSLMVKLRAAHRSLTDVVTLAQNVRGAGADDLREAVALEVGWIRGACDVIETGVNGGPLDAQLRALLDAEETP